MVDSVPSNVANRSARFSPLRSLKIPCSPASGPSNTFTLSPGITGSGSSLTSPVSGSQRLFTALITTSGNLASSMPKRTSVTTPRVERTGPRLCWSGIAFRNKYLGNRGSIRCFAADLRWYGLIAIGRKHLKPWRSRFSSAICSCRGLVYTANQLGSVLFKWIRPVSRETAVANIAYVHQLNNVAVGKHP